MSKDKGMFDSVLDFVGGIVDSVGETISSGRDKVLDTLGLDSEEARAERERYENSREKKVFDKAVDDKINNGQYKYDERGVLRDENGNAVKDLKGGVIRDRSRDLKEDRADVDNTNNTSTGVEAPKPVIKDPEILNDLAEDKFKLAQSQQKFGMDNGQRYGDMEDSPSNDDDDNKGAIGAKDFNTLGKILLGDDNDDE